MSAGGAASTVANIEIVRAGNGNDVLVGGTGASAYSIVWRDGGDDRVGPGTLRESATGDVYDGGDRYRYTGFCQSSC